MRDLFRCLDEYPPELLRAISGVWQVSLPEGEPREMAVHLAQGMLAPKALEGALQGLGSDAREALAGIVKGGGAVPGHRLFAQYGGIRRLGPAGMAREQPWARPEGVLEELYYKGILYRAYATVADHHGEVYFIPQRLLDMLRGHDSEASDLDVARAPTPARIEHDGGALVEDLLAFLVCLRQGRVYASGGKGTQRAPSLDQIEVGSRLLGEKHPVRLALARRLLWRLGLLQDQGGLLRPSARARGWMRLPDRHRAQSVYLAWRDDTHWNELAQLPSLGLTESGWQADLVTARAALLSMLARCPTGQWLSLALFLEGLKRHRPDYLRPDGDYDSWYVRDAATGDYLAGFASWNRVEGALASYVITSSLRWLGIVDVGYGIENDEPIAFRIAEQGWSLLAGEPEPTKSKGRSSSRTLAIVGDDFSITITVGNTMYERYQLERFAEWQGQDAMATYRITADSVWRGYNAGVKTGQMAGFLSRITQNKAPPAVLRTLQAWGGRFGRATLAKTLVLRTADEGTMQQLESGQVRGLLGETVSPTARLVDQEHVDELIKQLKEMGIWPSLEDWM